jgi:hypothetical protein
VGGSFGLQAGEASTEFLNNILYRGVGHESDDDKKRKLADELKQKKEQKNKVDTELQKFQTVDYPQYVSQIKDVFKDLVNQMNAISGEEILKITEWQNTLQITGPNSILRIDDEKFPQTGGKITITGTSKAMTTHPVIPLPSSEFVLMKTVDGGFQWKYRTASTGKFVEVTDQLLEDIFEKVFSI